MNRSIKWAILGIIIVAAAVVLLNQGSGEGEEAVTLSPVPTVKNFASDCKVLSSNEMTISVSDREGYCNIVIPLKGYKTIGYDLDYPAGWTVRRAGAEGMNLIFNEGVNVGKNRKLFLQLTITDLPLEEAYKATYSYEWSGPDPLVGEEEIIQDKKVEQVGDKRTLVLLTTRGKSHITRYFLTRAGNEYTTLYMFEFEMEDSEYGTNDYTKFLDIVKEIITSMQFTR